MSVGAACGMVYEYLIAHYAGRILGSVDTAVYGMIGLMVVSMGVGAFYARTVKCPYTGFAWLESVIALIGGAAVIIMAGIFSLAYVLPSQLQDAFGVHESIEFHGGIVFIAQQVAEAFPYIIGFVLGLLIGMEIPFIARIREDVYKTKLEHNAGTVYGVDYIGAGFGAAIWVFICLQQPIIYSAAFTALLNVVLGSVFLFHFYPKVKHYKFLIAFKCIVAVALFAILLNGNAWLNAFSNMLYLDEVEFSKNTKYQNLVLTERHSRNSTDSILSLYINGHLQFASNDEAIYHGMLVEPALLASARKDNILVVGGGDGLAVRDLLRHDPKKITLVELDPEMIKIFQGKHPDLSVSMKARIERLTQNSLNDPRVDIVYGDAFRVIESMVGSDKYFDAIIVDLPDPNHPDLNKLYSVYFYRQLSSLLSGDGAMVVQSTSPYHSKDAFLSIGKTMASSGLNIDQYHTNVPSFGEWGWSIGTKLGLEPKQRIINASVNDFSHNQITLDFIRGSFAFPANFFADYESIKANYLTAPTLYTYHSEGWRINDGVFVTN